MEYLKQLETAFHSTMNKTANGINRAAVLFSGGVDSSLIAKAVAERIPETVLFVVGLEKSKDIEFAEFAAKKLDLKLKKIIVKKEEVPAFAEKTAKAIGSTDLLQLQIGVPEYIALEAVKKDGFKTVFSGQGADELFCGYDEFRKILKEKGYNGVRAEILKKLKEMPERNLKRENALYEYFNLIAIYPLMEKEFIEIALKIPAQEKIFPENDLLRKRIFRKLAESQGIPKEICERKKTAIQYGSGLSKEVKKYLKNKKYSKLQ